MSGLGPKITWNNLQVARIPKFENCVYYMWGRLAVHAKRHQGGVRHGREGVRYAHGRRATLDAPRTNRNEPPHEERYVRRLLLSFPFFVLFWITLRRIHRRRQSHQIGRASCRERV